jgi:hypothetical protein
VDSTHGGGLFGGFAGHSQAIGLSVLFPADYLSHLLISSEINVASSIDHVNKNIASLVKFNNLHNLTPSSHDAMIITMTRTHAATEIRSKPTQCPRCGRLCSSWRESRRAHWDCVTRPKGRPRKLTSPDI